MINIKNLNKFNNNDSGISQVIGVILIVAATIVISGAIIAMIEGFTPIHPPKIVSVVATHATPTTVLVLFHGGPDGGQVIGLNTTMNAGSVYQMIPSAGATTIRVGDSTILTGATPGPDNDHIIVTARFTDGIEQVVLDTRV